jgi:hypothetical protein
MVGDKNLDMRLNQGCSRKAPLRYNNNWELDSTYGGESKDTIENLEEALPEENED